MTYDHCEAEYFLTEEVPAQELYDDILAALSEVAAMENRRNRRQAEHVWDTLLRCADLLTHIVPELDGKTALQ